MSPLQAQRLRQEMDLMDRFSQSYRRKFAVLIKQLNQPGATSDLKSLRLCIEAVDMMLASHAQVASSLRELTQSPVSRAA
jgi:hypothetical protein